MSKTEASFSEESQLNHALLCFVCEVLYEVFLWSEACKAPKIFHVHSYTEKKRIKNDKVCLGKKDEKKVRPSLCVSE